MRIVEGIDFAFDNFVDDIGRLALDLSSSQYLFRVR